MARMRTINQAAALLKEEDPSTAVTKTAIRRLVVTGVVPSVKVGSKYILSVEALIEFLQGQQVPAPAPAAPGVVRRVL